MPRSSLLRVALALGLAGCGDAACPEPEPEEEATLDPGPGLEALDDTPPAGCDATFLAAATGAVTDDVGEPVAGARVQLCVRTAPEGALLCLRPPTTDADGSFAIPVEAPAARCAEELTMRVLVPQGAAATTYCAVEAESDARGVVALDQALPLFRLARPDGCALPPEGDPEAPRDVTLGDGVTLLGLRPAQLDDYTALAAGRHPLEGSCLAPPPGTVAAWGFSESPVRDGGVAFELDNTAGLPAGTPVEFHLVGGLDTTLADGRVLEEAEWSAFGRGAVSEDGTRIVPDATVRLPDLTWLAVVVPGA
ncbi:MAG: hypothetical protein AAF447_16910 [Myxococcota bacterium]